MIHLEHSRRLDKECVLEIANRATNLDDRHATPILCGGGFYATQDFIAHVRDSFDTSPAISERTLARNDRLIHHATRHIVFIGKVAPQESFVVPHILIGLETASQDKCLTMLRRIHCPCIHIQIGINLYQIHWIPFLLEQEPNRARHHPFADAAHHTAKDEYIFVTFFCHTRLVDNDG